MTDIESLCRLTEAVEAAGADIAPTYLCLLYTSDAADEL